VISLTYIYAAGLSGFFTAFEEHQTISMKNEEYLSLSYTFNSATGLGNLTVTNAWAHPSRIVEILKVSPSGGVSVIPEDITLYPGQSYTFVNLLQKPYTYAVVTSYGNVWWSSFDMENPALGRYSLTMVASPPEGGTTSPPPGTYYYPYGTEVTISAAANPGWSFAGWTGTGNYSYSGTNKTATVYIWDDITETADFLAQPQPVTFAAKGLGSDAQGVVLTVSYTTSQAQGGSRSYSYTFTASQLPVTLEIPTGTQVSYSWSSPVPGSTGVRYVWVSTSGLDNAQSGTFTVPAGGGQVVATYATQYLLTMAASPSYAGTTNPAPGSYWEPAGARVQISATANSGYEFHGWAGSGSGSYSGSANPATVTMNGPVTETAVFYVGVTLSAQAGGSASASWSGGSASVSGPGSKTFYVPAGTSVQFSASPYSGWAFAGWTGSGTGSYSGNANPVSVTVDYPITETADFVALPQPVTITFSANGLGSDAQGTVLTVNGQSYGYSSLPVSITVPYGSTISYSWTSPVPGAAGVQYVWQSTSGLATAQSGSFTATQPGSVTATYQKQVEVTVQYISGSAPGNVVIYNPYVGTITSGSITFWVPAGSTVSMQAYWGLDSAGYPTLFQWYYDSDTGSTITSASYSLTPSSPDTIYVDYDYSGYVLVQAVTYVSGTVLQTLVSAYEPANMYYSWSPPSSISAYGESLSYISGPNSIWVQQDSWNTASDVYQEPAQWQNLNLQMIYQSSSYIAETTGYLIDPATGGGIGGQTIQIVYTEWFYGSGGGGPPPDWATTNSQGYFSNLQGMPGGLTTVQAQISWYNAPSYYYNPGTATLEISGYWP